MLYSRQRGMNQLSVGDINVSTNSSEFLSQFNILCMESKQTDSNVTVQDQMIKMNPTFRLNRTFTRPNDTKFTHDIRIKMVD